MLTSNIVHLLVNKRRTSIKIHGTHNLKIGHRIFGLRASLQCFPFPTSCPDAEPNLTPECESTQNEAIQLMFTVKRI